jgi:hypothetical protein
MVEHLEEDKEWFGEIPDSGVESFDRSETDAYSRTAGRGEESDAAGNIVPSWVISTLIAKQSRQLKPKAEDDFILEDLGNLV